MKHLEVFLSRTELTEEASLAVAFSAVRCEGGPIDFDRRAISDNDLPVTTGVFETACRGVCTRLNAFVADCEFDASSVLLKMRVHRHNEHKAAELVPGLIRSAAVGLMTAAWQRVTAPQEADAAKTFADAQLTSVLNILNEGGGGVIRRPLPPM